MAQTTVAPSMTQGYALCSPLGVLLGHSYRKTEAEAIASVFENSDYRDQFWAEAKAEGWTLQFVYARIFTPAYFASQVVSEDTWQKYDVISDDPQPSLHSSFEGGREEGLEPSTSRSLIERANQPALHPDAAFLQRQQITKLTNFDNPALQPTAGASR